ncbi:hypothetical protein BY458DRAFT_545253 [Sporodiniella umbellata]|nr:hypothetical protein BY458DRAFT_545253 [Sporodiniella umbellata]
MGEEGIIPEYTVYGYTYNQVLSKMNPNHIHFHDLNPETQSYVRSTACTITYMSVCLACIIFQIGSAILLAWKSRKRIHFILLFQALLCFLTILCSVLNPITAVTCIVRFWVSIVSINLGGCCIQNILLYKAYLCYERSVVLLSLGLIINTGYIAITIIYALFGQVPTHKDMIGNCTMDNLEWPALVKLGIDILSNGFLSVAFLLVIFRHYRVFGNDLYKLLLSNGLMYSVGVIASNILTGILISTRAMGGLSADLYSFDWVFTSYLLIRQFKAGRSENNENNEETESVQSSRSYLNIQKQTLTINTQCSSPSHLDLEKSAFPDSFPLKVGSSRDKST